eukprot:6201388-Pleurochrysis_carterae.AAC.2
MASEFYSSAHSAASHMRVASVRRAAIRERWCGRLGEGSICRGGSGGSGGVLWGCGRVSKLEGAGGGVA